MVARRSCLSVPGSSKKMLAKSRSLPADELVIDLEDSVAPDAKAKARASVARLIGQGQFEDHSLAVRINGPATHWCHRDVIEVIAGAGEALGSLVVPKVESPGELEFVDRLTGMVEHECGRDAPVALQALIETATGLRNVHVIAQASPRLETLIVGYADLSASLGLPLGGQDSGDRWQYVLETVLVAARSAGLQAIDGPYLAVEDHDGFRAAAQRARAMGYDGKWALHPTQIDLLNELFAPTAEEFARACAVLDALEAGEREEGRGALMLDGSMIDEASRKLAAQVVARGTASGAGTPRSGKDRL
ncbi:MAG: HpcH/HpaI aldolase/citrate lyase family protein [Solirubrobacteraceae bacterium]